ncbi:MAG: 3-hydroxy-3-methylglutaryl CoA synthase [Actinomycetia bacterium]|nr:3-hydroxy-3-methylglutaryl CoA synthase [Actinomycetes bacterium]
MRGITGWGVHLPYRRLDRTTITAVAGTGGGTGTRTVASYDEDTTTMGAEAARAALRGSQAERGREAAGSPRSLWFATTEPAYADKTNATVLHAVLRLDRTVPAYDAVGSARSAMAALRAGWQGPQTSLVVAADTRTGLPGSGDEAAGGDAAAALLIGDGGEGAPVLAEIVAWESVTEEFVDRWKAPGAQTSRLWEERFGETRYTELGAEALKLALGAAGIGADAVDHLIVAGLHDRAVAAVARKSGVDTERVEDRLARTVGNPGAAQPALLLAATLEKAAREQAARDKTGPGRWIVLLSLADGADAVVLRTTEALAAYRPYRPVAAQVAGGGPISYGRYLHWRGFLAVEPPRRPEPARVSSPAARRNADWKYAFVASASSGGDATVHLPPSALDGVRVPAADATGTIVTFTVDKLSYSLSPPVVFAIVDFDGGGRLPIELTDVDASEVAIGGRVEMTFRRLSTAGAIHNYFWKARPVRGVQSGQAEG